MYHVISVVLAVKIALLAVEMLNRFGFVFPHISIRLKVLIAIAIAALDTLASAHDGCCCTMSGISRKSSYSGLFEVHVDRRVQQSHAVAKVRSAK